MSRSQSAPRSFLGGLWYTALAESSGLLLAPSGESFATGSAEYFDADPGIRDPLPRIYVEFWPEGAEMSFLALLDTGGHYCILNTSVIEEIGEDRLVDKVGHAELRTALGLIRGDLYIHRITLIADSGRPLGFEATVFVSPDWQGANFIGYAGALDRMCFAVNPQKSRLYFGPLG